MDVSFLLNNCLGQDEACKAFRYGLMHKSRGYIVCLWLRHSLQTGTDFTFLTWHFTIEIFLLKSVYDQSVEPLTDGYGTTRGNVTSYVG